MEYGSLAEWFAAFATAGTLVFSLYLLQQERQLRLRAQATRISTWAEWDRTEPGRHERPFFAYVNNSSDAPIYVDVMAVSQGEGPEPFRVRIGTVPAHATRDFGLDVTRFPPGGDVPLVEIQFLDADRVRWRRNSCAALQRIGPVKGSP
jgi:hypothetical protein